MIHAIHSPEIKVPTRRDFLARGIPLAAAAPLFLAARYLAAEQGFRLEQPNVGTAGAVWRPLIEKQVSALKLPVQWVGGDPGQSQVQLLAGAIDIGFFGPIGAAETDLRGKEVVIFAPGLINHGSWIVKGNSSFKAPYDLKGRRIATQPETTETYRQARLAAGLVGLDLRRDFQIIFGPPTANLALFERGDVDAVITIEPISTRLIADGAREIARVRDQWRQGTNDARPLFLGGQGATRAWYEQNRQTAHELEKLYIEANKQIQARPQILGDLHQLLGVPAGSQAAIDLLIKRLPEIYGTEWSPLIRTDADRILNIAVKDGVLKSKPVSTIFEIA